MAGFLKLVLRFNSDSRGSRDGFRRCSAPQYSFISPPRSDETYSATNLISTQAELNTRACDCSTRCVRERLTTKCLHILRYFRRYDCWRVAILATAIVCCSLSNYAIAQADAPPKDFTNLGPHFVIAPGLGAVTEYRDLLLKRDASLRLGVTATFRGFTLSGFAENSMHSPASRASELSATYSHKLPLVDAHLGLVTCDVLGNSEMSCGDVRVSFSSNSLPKTKMNFTFDASPSGRGQTFDLGISQQVWRMESHLIDVRLSGTRWDRKNSDANGWSIRLIGVRALDTSMSLHYHLGYISSRIKTSNSAEHADGVVGGLNVVWEFR
jgi:hypothetical protein